MRRMHRDDVDTSGNRPNLSTPRLAEAEFCVVREWQPDWSKFTGCGKIDDFSDFSDFASRWFRRFDDIAGEPVGVCRRELAN